MALDGGSKLEGGALLASSCEGNGLILRDG